MNNMQFLHQLVGVARKAGNIIMQIYATDFVVHGKEDNSPVTEADDGV